MLERVVNRSPDQRSFVLPRVSRTPVVLPPPTGSFAATWLGHSTVLLQFNGVTMLTDPVWAHRVSPVPFVGPRRRVPPMLAIADLPPIDVVLLSHNHYDHFDVKATRTIAKANPAVRWCVPLGLREPVRRCGVQHITELDWWQSSSDTVANHDVHITAVPAQHFSGRGLTDRNRTLWCGFVVCVAGARVYYAGDSGYHAEWPQIARHTGPFDLTMLPIGAYEPRWLMTPVHMNPEEAVRAWHEMADVQREVHGVESAPMMGVHWGTYKLTDEPLDEPPRRTRAIWNRASFNDDALWTPAHGETRQFVSGAGITSTRDDVR